VEVQKGVIGFLRHPDAHAKVQAEMDRVIGTWRLPNQDDLPNLPYFNAFIQETLRLGGLTPVSLPRDPTRDIAFPKTPWYLPSSTP